MCVKLSYSAWFKYVKDAGLHNLNKTLAHGRPVTRLAITLVFNSIPVIKLDVISADA